MLPMYLLFAPGLELKAQLMVAYYAHSVKYVDAELSLLLTMVHNKSLKRVSNVASYPGSSQFFNDAPRKSLKNWEEHGYEAMSNAHQCQHSRIHVESHMLSSPVHSAVY